MNAAEFTLPKALPGFEAVNRYWDRRMNLPAAKILPGEFYVSTQGEMIGTVLGSCISACIRDTVIGVGGMNHFMLPVKGGNSTDGWGGSEVSASLRYGNWAMEYLINEILKQGGHRDRLEVKIFGGGQVLKNMTDIGSRNIEFVRAYLFKEGLSVISEDVGDVFPRKVLYFPDTGAVKLKKLRTVNNSTVEQRERKYITSINTEESKGGDVELF
jgi:chemotaxis protein CheD